jgi:hypothetical protein
VPPKISALAAFRFAGDDRAGCRTDCSSGNDAARTAANCTTNNSAERAADKGTAERVLRGSLLRRYQCRDRQERPCPQSAHHVVFPSSTPPLRLVIGRADKLLGSAKSPLL